MPDHDRRRAGGRRAGSDATRRSPRRAESPGTLFVCATPIGNLGDITLRVLETLKNVQLIAAEDTRHTRKLLSHFDIHTPATSLFAHNEAAKTDVLLRELRAGHDVALVTDAGLPGVSDPGARAVAAVIAAGLPVTVLPGASAPATAVVAAGLDPDAPWCFVGFLPRRPAELRTAWAGWQTTGAQIVAFETAVRLPRTLRELAALGPAVRGAVCRELTKLHEEVVRGTLAELAARYAGAAGGVRGGRVSDAETTGAGGAVPGGSVGEPEDRPSDEPVGEPGERLRGEITLVIDLSRAPDAGPGQPRAQTPEVAARRLLDKGLSRRDTALALSICLGMRRREADELVRSIAAGAGRHD